MTPHPFDVVCVAEVVQSALLKAWQNARDNGLVESAKAYERAYDYARKVVRRSQDAASTRGPR